MDSAWLLRTVPDTCPQGCQGITHCKRRSLRSSSTVSVWRGRLAGPGKQLKLRWRRYCSQAASGCPSCFPATRVPSRPPNLPASGNWTFGCHPTADQPLCPSYKQTSTFCWCSVSLVPSFHQIVQWQSSSPFLALVQVCCTRLSKSSRANHLPTSSNHPGTRRPTRPPRLSLVDGTIDSVRYIYAEPHTP